MESNNKSPQFTNSILPIQENIINNNLLKNRKKIKIFFLFFIFVLFLFSVVIIVLKNNSLTNGMNGVRIPKSYADCLNLSDIKNDYEHNNYRCIWRTNTDNVIQYALCKAAKGNTTPGLVGFANTNLNKLPDMCEIVFYNDDFKIPQSFDECLPYSIMSTTKDPGSEVQSCVISIDLWGYNENQAKSLYNACDELGRKSFIDDIQSDTSRGNCTLFFWKGRKPLPEIYRSATYSATSSAFIKKVLLTQHNQQLSKYDPTLVSPTPTLTTSLSQTLKSCQESGGEWNNASCDCHKTIDKDNGCSIDKKYFPFIDDKNLSNQPEPPVNGSNDLEELVFKDDLSSCSYLGNKNNTCAVCQQDSDCGNEYKDDWYYWIRYAYGPTCDNGYCKYRRVIFRTELDYDGKLFYGSKK